MATLLRFYYKKVRQRDCKALIIRNLVSETDTTSDEFLFALIAEIG